MFSCLCTRRAWWSRRSETGRWRMTPIWAGTLLRPTWRPAPAPGGGSSPWHARWEGARLTTLVVKATSWSTNYITVCPYFSNHSTDPDHIVSTCYKLLIMWNKDKFQLICTWVTMLTKYIILPIRGKVRSKNKNFDLPLYMLVTCHFFLWIYLLADNHPFISTQQRWTWIYFIKLNKYLMFVIAVVI